MANLKRETLNDMKRYRKTIDDIEWIGGSNFSIPVNLFFELADVEYRSDSSSQEVAYDLRIVFKDNSVMYRRESNGMEWWGYMDLNPHKVERDDIITLVSKDECGHVALQFLN